MGSRSKDQVPGSLRPRGSYFELLSKFKVSIKVFAATWETDTLPQSVYRLGELASVPVLRLKLRLCLDFETSTTPRPVGT